MIYLNNAATSHPKPPGVTEAVCQALSSPPCEKQRGTLGGTDAAELCRRALAPVLGVREPSRIFFTSGATESYNLILRGLHPAGKVSVVSAFEHNALLRPLWTHTGGEGVRILTPDDDGILSPDILRALAMGADFVFVNHCSNVTGAVQDLSALSRAAHENGALLIADVSQSAGMMPLNLDESGTDIAVFTGHKALFGPAGTGGFYLRAGVPLPAAKWGGTGSGGRMILPDEPESFEVGTQNLCGLAGLAAGAAFVSETGLDAIARAMREKVARLHRALDNMTGVRVYGKPSGGAAVAFNIDGLSPADVGYILRHGYDIVVRTGYHCAPLLADAIGAPGGTVRASLSYYSTDAELEQFLHAVSEIATGMKGVS
jgi:selenocysteine lyase/cysteine desulfurase